MFFITNRKILFGLIGALALACVGALSVWGLQFGIEFTGGTLVEVRYDERPTKEFLEARLAEVPDLGTVSLRASGEQGYMLRTRDVTEAEYQQVQEALAVEGSGFEEERRATVGPSIGGELKNKALAAIAVVSLLIILYVAFAFRNVQSDEDEDEERQVGVSSWTYGFIAIFVLLHDLLVPLGMFAVLGQFAGAEVDVLIVMALLTILGYSVNDTIVIFDRVRENLLKNKEDRVDEPFAETVGRSLSQTYARSINTSLTTLLVVCSLLVFGGSTTTYFALVLATGVLAGTYSSLALAAPLLVTVEERQRRERDETKESA